MADSKMTIYEYMAFEEDDAVTAEGVLWAIGFLSKLIDDGIHKGDCTSMPMTCSLCCLQGILEGYKKYYFNK